VIVSLADAWQWYESALVLTRAIQRLGERYWEGLPWATELGRDNRLGSLEAVEIHRRSGAVLADLNDLCVLLLFSVFEAQVRERALADVAAELPAPHHPAVRHALQTLKENIASGNFFHVLEAYKGIDPDLVEQVNQVRKYRNWVAHGRRDDPENLVEPGLAFARLQRFLDLLGPLPAKPLPPTGGS
jgi:hypothetical protein